MAMESGAVERSVLALGEWHADSATIARVEAIVVERKIVMQQR